MDAGHDRVNVAVSQIHADKTGTPRTTRVARQPPLHQSCNVFVPHMLREARREVADASDST